MWLTTLTVTLTPGSEHGNVMRVVHFGGVGLGCGGTSLIKMNNQHVETYNTKIYSEERDKEAEKFLSSCHRFPAELHSYCKQVPHSYGDVFKLKP